MQSPIKADYLDIKLNGSLLFIKLIDKVHFVSLHRPPCHLTSLMTYFLGWVTLHPQPPPCQCCNFTFFSLSKLFLARLKLPCHRAVPGLLGDASIGFGSARTTRHWNSLRCPATGADWGDMVPKKLGDGE